MIRYALKCPAGHGFESWFQSASAYESLRRAGHVTCPECGSGEVEKALMAPSVATAETRGAVQSREAELAALRRKIEETSDYVGGNFVKEARAMHQGEAPERAIYGEAKPEEAIQLLEEGVPVAPLPFLPKRKAN
jgi:hypothetical protein